MGSEAYLSSKANLSSEANLSSKVDLSTKVYLSSNVKTRKSKTTELKIHSLWDPWVKQQLFAPY